VVLSDGGTPGGVHGVSRVLLLGGELGSSLVALHNVRGVRMCAGGSV